MGMRIERELPAAGSAKTEQIYAELRSFWGAGLLAHFRAECGCLLALLFDMLSRR
jgi:hypothetical protein